MIRPADNERREDVPEWYFAARRGRQYACKSRPTVELTQISDSPKTDISIGASRPSRQAFGLQLAVDRSPFEFQIHSKLILPLSIERQWSLSR